MSDSGIFPSDDWVLSEGQTEVGPIIVRVRSGEPSSADKALFTNLLVVRWAYEAGEFGLPPRDVLESMVEFEDRILDASDGDRWWGSGVAVITHDGVREWRFYTPDVGAFQAEFSRALAGLGPYPLDLQVFEDPEWVGFSEIRDLARSA